MTRSILFPHRRSITWLCLAVLTVLTFVSIRPAAATTQCYYIQGATHSLVLDVAGESTASGAAVIVWPKKDVPAKNQLWTYTDGGPIRSLLNGYVLQAGTESGAPVLMRSFVTHMRSTPMNLPQQLWTKSVANLPHTSPLRGSVLFKNSLHGHLLDAQSGTPAPGTAVVTTAPTTNTLPSGQLWKFVPAPSCGS